MTSSSLPTRTHLPRRSALPRRAALLGLFALPLAACGGGSGSGSGSDRGGASGSDGGSAGASASPIEVEDPWIKATDTDMTGAFATLRNTGSADLTLIGASCDDAGMVELHEVTDGAMRPVEGGLPIPAGGELRLEPGGYHVMLMDLRRELVPGDQVAITLELKGGATVPLQAVVKDYSGAKENYRPGGASDAGGAGPQGGGPHGHGHGPHDEHGQHDGHGPHDEHGQHDGHGHQHGGSGQPSPRGGKDDDR